jgi:CheY-like chemotaxis protein
MNARTKAREGSREPNRLSRTPSAYHHQMPETWMQQVPDTCSQPDLADFEAQVAQGFPVLLLAEDDIILRNLLLVVLEGQGYAVLVAVDGKDAIELSRIFGGEIKMLLTDMEMPRMGGDELGEVIMRERPGIRILQMSGRIAESFIDRNLSLPFFQKPFIASVLIEKLSEVLAAPAGTIRKPN